MNYLWAFNQQEMVIPIPVSMFLNEILYLYYQIVEL